MVITPSKVCAAIATILFACAVFGVALGSVPLVPLGLAFFAAAHLF